MSAWAEERSHNALCSLEYLSYIRKRRPNQYYSRHDKARDHEVMSAWAEERQRQRQRGASRAGQRKQEVDDAVRLGRARRLVSAVERAIHILEQQVRLLPCQ